jgi:formiminoglutamase
VNARDWLARAAPDRAALALIGAPISKASISPSQAWVTPSAFRAALQRFPTWDAEHRIDLEDVFINDTGDVEGDRDDLDATAAHGRIEDATASASGNADVIFVVGGDNSLTAPAMRGLIRERPGAGWGLLTLDAHHDCRPLDDGPRNGTPVRELIEEGLPGSRVAQVGVNPFGNAAEHARWAADQGIHVFAVDQVRDVGIASTLREALLALGDAGADVLYVDFDIDVADRAYAPACPASLPGGLRPDELLLAAHLLGEEPRVAAADITEVDANADVAGMTVRLAAAVFLAFCAGVAARGRRAQHQ